VQRREPILNAPASVLAVISVLALIHAIRSLLSADQDDELLAALAFVPARYDTGGDELPGGGLARLTSLVTHMLLHGDVVHLLINSAWLLVFGTPIARRLGTARFLAFLAFCGACGAATFWLFNPHLNAPMVGASGAISGLMAGVLRFLFNALDLGHAGLMEAGTAPVPRMTVGQLLRDRRALVTIVIWLALNFALVLGVGDIAPPGAIAWEAHLGGFTAGLLTFGYFDRPPALRRDEPSGT
jgi:membrane associated rhomboid family serine protease